MKEHLNGELNLLTIFIFRKLNSALGACVICFALEGDGNCFQDDARACCENALMLSALQIQYNFLHAHTHGEIMQLICFQYPAAIEIVSIFYEWEKKNYGALRYIFVCFYSAAGIF